MQKVLVPKERSLHEVPIREISDPIFNTSNNIAQVKGFSLRCDADVDADTGFEINSCRPVSRRQVKSAPNY
jgi:hypothetical protein